MVWLPLEIALIFSRAGGGPGRAALTALLFPVLARYVTPRLTLCGAAALVGAGYLMFLPFHDTLAQTLTNMVVAGLGSAGGGAALGRGGSFASAVFGIALLSAATDALADGVQAQATAAPLSGYLTVWTVCSITGFIAAGLLLLVPRLAFADVPLTAADTGMPEDTPADTGTPAV